MLGRRLFIAASLLPLLAPPSCGFTSPSLSAFRATPRPQASCSLRSHGGPGGGAALVSMNGGGGQGGKKRKAGRVMRITIEEMHEGIELEGIVRSVKDYGAFIDVGSTTDGLLHISQMLPQHRQHVGNHMVVTASEGEKVWVEVISVDHDQGRFALREVEIVDAAPKQPAGGGGGGGAKGGFKEMTVEEAEALYGDVVTGDEVVSEEQEAKDVARKRMEKFHKRVRKTGENKMRSCVVTSVTEYGAFLDMGGVDGVQGMLHVSKMQGKAVDKYGKIRAKSGDTLMVRVTKVDVEGGRVELTMEPYHTPDTEIDEEAMETIKRINEEAGSGAKSAFTAAWEEAVRKGGSSQKGKR